MALAHWLEDWRCTLVTPLAPNPFVWVSDMPFSTWEKRSTFLYFRDSVRKCSRAQSIRDIVLSLKHEIPSSFIDVGRTTIEGYRDELFASKFCLIMDCDGDSAGSRFYDALNSLCIPVFISNAFLLKAAPFAGHINYNAFTVHIPEELFRESPQRMLSLLFDYSQKRIERMYEQLIRHREILLWSHPQSKVMDWILHVGLDECAYSSSSLISN